MYNWSGITNFDDPLGKNTHLFECSVGNCRYRVTCKDIEDAEHIKSTHQCPWNGGETKIGLMVSKTILENIWDMLDAEVVTIKTFNSDDDRHLSAKSAARAYAKVLALFMNPHFRNPQEISAESLRRYNAKQNGDDDYCTVGMGRLRLQMPIGNRERTSSPMSATRPISPRLDAAIDNKTRQAIKTFAATGNFPLEKIAQLYKITKNDVEKVLAS